MRSIQISIFAGAILLAGAGCRAGQPPSVPKAAAVMQLPAPPAQRFKARDDAMLAFREFTPAASAAPPKVVAILYHGSAGNSRNMTLVGEALADAGIPAFAPDVRGQGLSGRRGDVDYIGQPQDDLADFVAVVRRRYPDARLVLAGHSSGGGFVIRVAGEPLGRAFSRFVLLSPYLGRAANLGRPDAGWVKADASRIFLIDMLHPVGVRSLDDQPVICFNTPTGADDLGLTHRWSYRMAMSYGPQDDLNIVPPPAYRVDAARAPSPIVLIAGAHDEQFFADRYAKAFEGLENKVSVEIAPEADHMGVLSDPGALALIVQAIGGAAS